MVIDKIRKMSIKGVKLKSERFFSISPGVLELWRKNLREKPMEENPPVQIGLNLANAFKTLLQDLLLCDLINILARFQKYSLSLRRYSTSKSS